VLKFCKVFKLYQSSYFFENLSWSLVQDIFLDVKNNNQFFLVKLVYGPVSSNKIYIWVAKVS